jgi:nitrite reductase/ring-hydroxylating ferredoxin subunit
VPSIALGDVAELKRHALQCLHHQQYQFVLIYKDLHFYLLDNLCPHKAAALCEGKLQGDAISCPWHQALFDIRTGHGLSPLAGKGVRSYPVSEVDGQLMVELP